MKSIFLLIACLFVLKTNPDKDEQKSNIPLQSIDIVANMNNFKQANLSQFSGDIKYIPLETKEDALLRVTYNFDISDKHIVITDGTSCLLYDLTGHFIRKFGTKGRGPEEYQYISNLTISNDKKIIFTSSQDLFEFNTDGSFSSKYSRFIDPKFYLSTWHLVNDSLLLCVFDNLSGRDEFKALLVSKNGVVKQKLRNYEVLENKGSRIFNGIPKIYEFNKSVYLKEQFNDTLFSLNKNYELTPQFTFNLGKLKMPPDVRTVFSEWTKRMNDYVLINETFQTPDYLLLNVNLGNRGSSKTLGIFNKKSKEFFFCQSTNSENPLSKGGFINDIDAGPMFFPVKMINDYTMAMIIEAKQLKDYLKSSDFKNNNPKFPDKKKQLEELGNKLTEFDNPILVLVTFKK
jgi:transposase-like protein